MVMHARKPQRIGDGYHFEKHQAHPYQNSKYGSSKSYERERMRDRDSPNGNSYRSESPDDRDSPRTDRLYHKTSSYISNKRDRDYKRDKYSDCVKSPKDKRSRLDSDHRTNHDRNSSEKMLLNSVKSQNSSRDTSQRKLSSSCQDKRDGERERDRGERVCRVGDWSEHVSSSGKKYYYNCKTEVSQWEKPREWVLDRCYNNNSSLDNQSRSHTRHPHSSSSSYIHHSSQSSHPNSRTGGSSIADKHSNSRGGPVSKPQQSVSQPSMIPPVQGMVPPPQGMVPPPQGMVPPPQGMVPPPQGMVPPPQGMVPPPQGMVPPPVQVNTVVRPVPAPQTVAPPSSYWATPHMIETSSNDPRKPQDSQPNNNSVDGVGTDMDICSGDSTPTSETNYPGEGCTQSTISSNVHSSVLEGSVNTPGPPVQLTTANLSNNIVVRVSPTNQESESTHENQDCKVGGSLLAGSSLGALRPQGPNLTPSLANHYRDDLVNHVRGWPADIIEKQAQKLSEEAYQLGTMCARVSAELKCPRSLVRQTEIQATRQEQRVLFLRQQIKTLEELKSQNSFMADET